MPISRSAPITTLWRWLTEPIASMPDPDARQRSRAAAATLLLTMALVTISLVRRMNTSGLPTYLYFIFFVSLSAYAICRTRYYRAGGILAILTLWLVPTYGVLFGISDTPAFVFSSVRLLLLALLLTYVVFSMRVSIALGALIGISILLMPPATPFPMTQPQFVFDFLQTAGAIFFVFFITRRFDSEARERVEAARHASDERYRAIVEIQTEMICRWLPDGMLTFVNEAYCRYFNACREKLIGTPVLALIYDDDLPLVRQMLNTIDREHPSVTYEHRVMNPAGELRWHQWTDLAIFNPLGEVIEYQSVGRDITELRLAQAAERHQREFAEALADTAALISSTLSLDEVLDRILNQIAAANPLHSAEIIMIEGHTAYVARSFGYNDPDHQHSVLDMRFSLETTRNLRDMMETGLPVIVADVETYEGWVKTEGVPTMRSALGAPIRLEGETIGFVSITSTTPNAFTTQHAAETQAFADQAAIAIRNARLYAETHHYAEELERLVRQRTSELELANQRLSVTLEGTGEGIFYTEAQELQYVNKAFCRLTGYTENELIGQSIMLLGDPTAPEKDIERLNAIRDSALQGNIWRGETRVRRKDGSLLDAALTVAIQGDPGAPALRAVTVVRDISREKALQAQRSNLVAYASHELRTPITNLKTRLYLLRRRPELLEQHLEILDEVTERMRQLVEDLLDMSRMEHGLIPLRRKEVSLQSVIRSVVTLQQPEAERKNISLLWTLPELPVFVSGDRERLIQVLTNLVTNAINYTPAGGTVTVTIRQDDSAAQIVVEDTGIGISKENLPYIFQPFYRVVSEVEGTGLGLSIAKEIIDLHKGTLQVQSQPGRGSTFVVSLPRLNKPVQVG